MRPADSAGNGDGTFGRASFVIADLGYNQGWRVETHARMLGDVTGDGAADIVACGDAGVWTALSTGTGFAGPKFVLADFGTHTDVVGNGRADIVGLGDAGVWIGRF